MMILTLDLKPPLSSIQGALDTLEGSRPAIEGMAGCLEFSITVETKPGGAIHIGERWETEADIRRHFRSASFRKILELMELSEVAPNFRVYKVVESFGLEVVDGPSQGPGTRSESAMGRAADGDRTWNS